MSYPPAPWRLRGHAVQSLYLVDSSVARAFIPGELRVVAVVPGKTLAAVYAGHYGPGSDLEYNELIVAPGLVRLKSSYGMWISHIYVDNPDALAGGHEIWGLPKELAEFRWQEDAGGAVTIRQGVRPLCSMSYGRRRWLWRQPMLLPCLTSLDSDLLAFTAAWSSRFSLARVALDVPASSPFAPLGLGRYGLPYHYHDMHFVASPPRVVGHTGMPLRMTTAPEAMAA